MSSVLPLLCIPSALLHTWKTPVNLAVMSVYECQGKSGEVLICQIIIFIPEEANIQKWPSPVIEKLDWKKEKQPTNTCNININCILSQPWEIRIAHKDLQGTYHKTKFFCPLKGTVIFHLIMSHSKQDFLIWGDNCCPKHHQSVITT